MSKSNSKSNNKLLNPAQEQVITDLCKNYAVFKELAAKSSRFVVFGSGERRLVVLVSPMGGLLEAAIRTKGQTDLF